MGRGRLAYGVRMARDRVLAIVQGGGKGSRMDVLTRERAKPALPFAGIYQLVDFPMSNLRHSGIEDVWLSVQYQADSLDEQVSNGRSWDLDRDRGGFRMLMPQQGGSPDADGFAAGNADELFRMRDQIDGDGASQTLVLSADHVYRFDFREAIETHRRKQAECTIVTSEVARSEAGHHATVVANRLGRVTDFAYKPSRPKTGTVATEMFVYDTRVLLDVLDDLHRELTATTTPDSNGLGDFGEHLLPRLVDRGRVFAHAMPGYWKDLGRPEAYLEAHQDLLRGSTGLFSDPAWPIIARLPQRSPALVRAGARIEDSLVSPGCDVRGVVRRSVLGPGVVVEEGARVTDSVVFADVLVDKDATVAWSIVDRGTTIGAGARVGARPPRLPLEAEHLVLVGRDSRVSAGTTVPRGARLEPGTTA
jgi:glucose-1-phosphate adenylyltransferase